MMKDTEINDGGPVFPGEYPAPWGQMALNAGLSKRDWLAGMALAGFCANPNVHEMMRAIGDPVEINEIIAKDAYSAADAMLAARSTIRTLD